jgi:hypothetical protein
MGQQGSGATPVQIVVQYNYSYCVYLFFLRGTGVKGNGLLVTVVDENNLSVMRNDW